MTIRTLILFGALAASVPASAQILGPWVVFDLEEFERSDWTPGTQPAPIGHLQATPDVEAWDLDALPATGFVLVADPSAGLEHPGLTFQNGRFGGAERAIDTSSPTLRVDQCRADRPCRTIMYLQIVDDGAGMAWFRAPGVHEDAFSGQPGDTLVFSPTDAPPLEPMPVIDQG